MNFNSIVLLGQLVFFALSASLFGFKYRSVQQFKSRHKNIDISWILWYHPNDILGTTSSSRRMFMQRQNRLSIIMWVCVLLLILISFLPLLLLPQ